MVQNEQTMEEHSTLKQQSPGRLDHPAWCVMWTVYVYVYREQGMQYLAFRFWIGMWLSLLLLLMVAFDLSALVRYITRFTEESFAILIALIFIFEAFKKLIHILDEVPVAANCTCLPPAVSGDNTSLWSMTTTASSLGRLIHLIVTTHLCISLYDLLASVIVRC